MTAISQRLLHLRPVLRSHPLSLHQFSSSSDSDIPQPKSESESQSQPSVSSNLNDIKAFLQREPTLHTRLQSPRKTLSANPPQSPPPSPIANYDEIRRNLSEFRIRSAPSPPSSASGQSISFQELYQRNVLSTNDNSATESDSPVKPSKLESIRNSVRQLGLNSPTGKNRTNDQLSLARFKEALSQKNGQNANAESQTIIGGSDGLPNFFGREKNGSGNDNLGSSAAMRTKFLKMYNYSDLGTKLKTLRPEKKKGKWFSLHELNERLVKLRQIEEQESQLWIGSAPIMALKDGLIKLDRTGVDDIARKKKMQRNVLGQLGGTPSFMLSPPKDHLVEKFFHPDNMSSAEKLKLELKKVRDEFKMSDSDCGSARVQVAQLTTKIKHLSTVLAKKDKHSRKGLQAMVQRRKKLLKYLRRTDWDSYSLVLSKLGLRDNPDIKA